MSIFSGMKEWIYGPQQNDSPSKDARLKKDFDIPDDGDQDTSPNSQVTYDVCLAFKRGGDTNVFPASQFLRDLRNLIDFADAAQVLQGMVNRKEVTLQTYEIASDGKPDKPAADTVIADAMLAAFMKSNGLSAPQDPAELSKLQQDLSEAQSKLSEQEQQITDLTTERDEAQAKLATAETALQQAQNDLQSAESSLDDAQKQIDATTAESKTAQQQLERTLLYVQKHHQVDLDPTTLDSKGNISAPAAPDPQASLQQIVTILQQDPANAPVAQMLQAMVGMIQPPKPGAPTP